uniref:Uncharacterized protein n=1 Tax=Oncorhynchus tshawytscha TaxID=74940 RepID=A0AAZ3S5E1_ONCTS
TEVIQYLIGLTQRLHFYIPNFTETIEALLQYACCKKNHFWLRPKQCGTDSGLRKVIFGKGIQLIIETREKHDPSYYSLKSSNTTACLATDFSAHNATAHLESFNKTEATRVKGDSYYSQVALGENCTEGGGSEKCEANWYFDTDAKINFLSLTILGLRILFLKTIVFNVLMTLRLWMS